MFFVVVQGEEVLGSSLSVPLLNLSDPFQSIPCVSPHQSPLFFASVQTAEKMVDTVGKIVYPGHRNLPHLGADR